MLHWVRVSVSSFILAWLPLHCLIHSAQCKISLSNHVNEAKGRVITMGVESWGWRCVARVVSAGWCGGGRQGGPAAAQGRGACSVQSSGGRGGLVALGCPNLYK